MNLCEEIKDIVKNDKEHSIKVEVDCSGICVYLIFDPANEGREDAIIPIKYSVCEQFAYIPYLEFQDMYNPGDYGLDIHEIILIKEIMELFHAHEDEIFKLCDGFSVEREY